MKKLLLTTTALVAVSFLASPVMAASDLESASPIDVIDGDQFNDAGAVSAEDLMAILPSYTSRQSDSNLIVNIRGYYNGAVSYTNVDDDLGQDPNPFNFASDSEIEFEFSTTLDNGLTIGANLQLDPEQDSDGSDDADLIDEAYGFVAAGWGRLEFGQTYGAGVKLGVTANNVVGHSVNGNDDNAMDPFAPYDTYTGLQWASLYNRIDTDMDFTNDGIKLSYFTPSFNGFQAGLSYSPNPCKNDTGYSDCLYDEFARHYWEAAARMLWQINNVAFILFGSYGAGESGNDSRDDPHEWSIGSSLEFGGLELTGVFTNHDNRYEYQYGNVFYDDVEQWTLSSAYTTGPWRIDLQFGESSTGLRVDNDYSWGDYHENQEYQSLLGGITYMLAPGVELGGGIQRIDFDYDTVGEFVDNQFATDGLSFFSGLRISF